MLWRSVEQCDGLVPFADESPYLSFPHIKPDDNHHDGLLVVVMGFFYW